MRCRLCASKSLTKVIKNEELYYYCQDCQLIFIDEKHIVSEEKEKQRYDEHDNSHENEGYVNMLEKFIETVIEPYQENINTVLEFGCGPGPVLADLLAERGFVVDRYDPYFFPEPIEQGKKYDLITSTEVFEHLKNPYHIIKKLKTHINKGGYLALMTSFHPVVDEFPDWWYAWDPTHITFYNSHTFAWIADEFDLELVFEDGDKYCLFRCS